MKHMMEAWLEKMEAKLETNHEKTECIKSMHMLTGLQGQVSDVLHAVLKGTTYTKTIRAKEDPLGYQQLATGYHDQLKSWTQNNSESTQKYVITIKQLTYHAFPALPKDHVRRGARKAFSNVIRH
jgi:hypothetical protein